MDPNATLDRIRKLVAEDDFSHAGDVVLDLVESIDALDEWLSAGGFLPSAWEGGRPRRDR